MHAIKITQTKSEERCDSGAPLRVQRLFKGEFDGFSAEKEYIIYRTGQNYCSHPSKWADKSLTSDFLCSKHGVSKPRGHISEAYMPLYTSPRCDRTPELSEQLALQHLLPGC